MNKRPGREHGPGRLREALRKGVMSVGPDRLRALSSCAVVMLAAYVFAQSLAPALPGGVLTAVTGGVSATLHWAMRSGMWHALTPSLLALARNLLSAAVLILAIVGIRSRRRAPAAALAVLTAIWAAVTVAASRASLESALAVLALACSAAALTAATHRHEETGHSEETEVTE